MLVDSGARAAIIDRRKAAQRAPGTVVGLAPAGDGACLGEVVMTQQTVAAGGTPTQVDRAGRRDSAFPLGAALLARPWLMRALSVLAVLLLWEWAGRLPVSPTFPTFTQTLAALFGMMA